MHNHFDLFGLAPSFSIEGEALERSYRDIQSKVHPDRFANAGDAERRASLQWTTRVNEAYRTLKDPVQRARHLLELHGVDVAFETNTAMPEQPEVRTPRRSATPLPRLARKDCTWLAAFSVSVTIICAFSCSPRRPP